jgi:acyl-CoA synthetase (AMP-forming)/AMP-acid ligase II
MNLMMLLEMASMGQGERRAVTGSGITLTGEELFQRAGVAAAQLRADGVGTLAYLAPNHPAYAVAMFAAAWAGVPFVPLNYRLATDQIVSLLDNHDDVAVVVEDVERMSLGNSKHRVLELSGWFAGLADGEVAAEPWSDDGDDIAILLYTSGTTAAPKAAILRQRHLVSYILGSVEFGGAAEDDAALVSVPTYHIAGVANLLSNLYAGRHVVYLDAFTPEIWLDTVRSQHVTQAMVVPTMLARIVQSLEGASDAGVPDLRALSYGGSRMPITVLERALELFPTTGFVNAYGLTETSSTIAVLGPDDHRAAFASDDPKARARLGSVGQLLPGVEVQIRRLDDTVADPEEAGELWVRGEQVSGEYLARESPLDAEGWFPTKDRAYIDSDGYLFIEGRTDDTIIRGGENIAPAEIEDVLLRHEGVAEAAVVGPPDDEWGQRLVAIVVALPNHSVDPEDLRQWAKTQLRSSKTPDEIQVWDELPQTATGKVIRRQILSRLEG